MKKVMISDFKAKCIAIIDDINRTRDYVIITRRGRPVAKLEPVGEEKPPRQFGKLQAKMRIKGDIVQTDFSSDWEINR
ncbi:MAG: type II toxin-antitoxin system Phd/YefM family antitoxin [Spirochaetes bacterium]|nr:type II toxin-antitoxin system Phd/YefM family antitoxin [Spirochaetota bacterium]